MDAGAREAVEQALALLEARNPAGAKAALTRLLEAAGGEAVEPLAPISVGELFDKLSILEIKLKRIANPDKLKNIRLERDALRRIVDDMALESEAVGQLFGELEAVNARLWTIEDDIREEEARGNFGARFIELARAVYVTNDLRADLKRRINALSNSRLVEEKSYADHGLSKR